MVEAHRQAEDAPAQVAVDPSLYHLVRFGQHIHALQVTIDLLIATRPDITWLKRSWDMNITHISDSLFDEPAPFGEEALKPIMLDAWKDMIRHFTQVIDGAVKAHRDSQNR